MIDHNENAAALTRSHDGVAASDTGQGAISHGGESSDATGYTEPPAHDPSQCECNSWGMGRPPCPDCKAVFAAKREQLLASIRESEGPDDREGDVLWHLGDDSDGEPRDSTEVPL